MYGDKIVGLGSVDNIYKGKYKYYKNKSKDYVSGEIVHIERSIRAFKRDSGDFAKERVKDYSKHLNKLWKIFYSKKNK